MRGQTKRIIILLLPQDKVESSSYCFLVLLYRFVFGKESFGVSSYNHFYVFTYNNYLGLSTFIGKKGCALSPILIYLES